MSPAPTRLSLLQQVFAYLGRQNIPRYTVWKETQKKIIDHPFSISNGRFKVIIYHLPTLRSNKMTRKGVCCIIAMYPVYFLFPLIIRQSKFSYENFRCCCNPYLCALEICNKYPSPKLWLDGDLRGTRQN